MVATVCVPKQGTLSAVRDMVPFAIVTLWLVWLQALIEFLPVACFAFLIGFCAALIVGCAVKARPLTTLFFCIALLQCFHLGRDCASHDYALD